MKKATGILLALAIGSGLSAANRWLISPCGQESDGVTWTIGEIAAPASHTSADRTMTLTTGFLQPGLYAFPSRAAMPPTARTAAYPNPVQTTLSVEADVPVNAWTLYDSTGQQVTTARITPATCFQVDFRHMPAGYYSLVLSTAEGKLVLKILK